MYFLQVKVGGGRTERGRNIGQIGWGMRKYCRTGTG